MSSHSVDILDILDRQTVSDAPPRRNHNLNILLPTGSRSDTAGHRRVDSTNPRLKGISHRTMAMVNKMAGSTSSSSSSGEEGAGTAHSPHSLASHSTHSPHSSSHTQSMHSKSSPSTPIGLRSHSSRPSPSSQPHTPSSSPHSSSPLSCKSYPPANPIPVSLNSAIFQKLHPSGAFHLDPMACESRDSEEETRLLATHILDPSTTLPDEDSRSSLRSHAGGAQETNRVRVCVVGDSGVGKTSVIRRYTGGEVEAEHLPTAGVNFFGKSFTSSSSSSSGSSSPYKLSIWDTGTCDIHLLQSYYSKSHAFGIIYDLTDYTSIEHIPQWIESIRRQSMAYILATYSTLTIQQVEVELPTSSSTSSLLHFAQSIPIVLIGNKADCPQRVVNSDTMESYARESGLCGYFEVSAVTNVNVDLVMDTLAHLGYQRQALQTAFVPDEDREQEGIVPELMATVGSYASLDGLDRALVPEVIPEGMEEDEEQVQDERFQMLLTSADSSPQPSDHGDEPHPMALSQPIQVQTTDTGSSPNSGKASSHGMESPLTGKADSFCACVLM